MVALAKVFVITKDEYDLIEDFILYYGSLVGLENIIVIDNGSTNAKVLEVYQKYRVKGLGGLYQNTTHVYNAGAVMTAYMQHYKNDCEFMLPLDTDEFLYFADRETMDRQAFEEYLRSIPTDASVIKYGKFMSAVPDQTDEGSYVNFRHTRPVANITRFYDQGWDKVFVRAATFEKIALGNHNAVVTSGQKIISKSLGLLHYQETGSLRQFERSANSIKGYGYVTMEETPVEQLRLCLKFRSGAGGHHCMYMVRFLLRMVTINKWLVRFGKSLPKMENMHWVDDLYKKLPKGLDVAVEDDKDVYALLAKASALADNIVADVDREIESYLANVDGSNHREPYNDAMKLKLIFGDWLFHDPAVIITQISNYVI
jgi:hypothetical protein